MKGILFKPDMCLAIQEGRKTVTRRLINFKQPDKTTLWADTPDQEGRFWFDFGGLTEHGVTIKPRYQVGDVVYIKEACCLVCFKHDGEKDACYKTDEDGEFIDINLNCKMVKWNSPLFMPAWAARHFIQITDVKAEKLQSITPADYLAEGSYMATNKDDEGGYINLWNSINPKYPWLSNPWVWRYEFSLFPEGIKEHND